MVSLKFRNRAEKIALLPSSMEVAVEAMGINGIEKVCLGSKIRSQRTRPWPGQRQRSPSGGTENIQGGRKEPYCRTSETREFPKAVCVCKALFAFSSTFSVWLRLILKSVLIPEDTVTDC